MTTDDSICAAYMAGIEYGRRLQMIEALAVISRLAGEAGELTTGERAAIVSNPDVAAGIIDADSIDPSPRENMYARKWMVPQGEAT